jgi:hypothetical protein
MNQRVTSIREQTHHGKATTLAWKLKSAKAMGTSGLSKTINLTFSIQSCIYR